MPGCHGKNVIGASRLGLVIMGSVADDKNFCIDIADSEEAIPQPGPLSGFATTKVTEVRDVIDPAASIA